MHSVDPILDTTLKLSEPMLRAACDLARHRDLTVGQIVRDALAAEIRRAGRKTRPQTATDISVRRVLAHNLAVAQDWRDLIDRFAAKGYALRPAGGGLALFRQSTGTRYCKASDLGASYGALMRRFGAPFPDDPHAHLAQRLLPMELAEPEEVIDF